MSVYKMAKIVIFVSTASKVCQETISYIIKNKIKADIVRLDTAESRKRAANGKYFQIKMVPTMLVSYEDQNMEIFIGNDKIMPVLSSFIPSERNFQQQNMYTLSKEGNYNPSKQAYAPRPNYPKPKDNEEVYIVENESDNEIYIERDDFQDEVYIEDSEPQGEEYEEQEIDEEEVKPKKKKKNSKKEEVYENEINDFKKPENKTVKNSRMQHLIDKAKDLEMQRLSSLGYNESDLPHYQ